MPKSELILAVPAIHPRLAAVLRAHSRVLRLHGARIAGLYAAAVAGGLAWAVSLWPHLLPSWAREIARVGWPATLGAFIVLVILERRGTGYLADLLEDVESLSE